MHKILPVFALLALSTTAMADEATEGLIKEAMEAPIRTEQETDRDDNRKPAETLSFFGMTKDMKVLELLPGGGWYTKILAPVLAEDGELHVALGTGRVKDNLLTEPGFEKIQLIDVDPGFERDGPFNTFTLQPFELKERRFDMVLNIDIVDISRFSHACGKVVRTKSQGSYKRVGCDRGSGVDSDLGFNLWNHNEMIFKI